MRAYVMRYDAPADNWNDALPLGNGSLGAMVYGETGIERIPLNDDSLWYGMYQDRSSASCRKALPEIRRLIFEGRMHEAEALILKHMSSAPAGMRRYVPLGELDIAVNTPNPFAMGGREEEKPEGYSRTLDLIRGVLEMDYRLKDVGYHREIFVSYAAHVMCVHLTADREKALQVDVRLDRVPMDDGITEDDRRPGLKARGRGWPCFCADTARVVNEQTFCMEGNEAGVRFAAAVRMECDGVMDSAVTALSCRDASEVTLYVASATTNRHNDPKAFVLNSLDAAQSKGYEKLREEHILDFSELMTRCEIDLGPLKEKTMEQLLASVRQGEPYGPLAALYFQFGRYLMVSGSRPDSSALNLQGIWNGAFFPLFDSKYTININLQMNYWLAQTGALPDLFEPFLNLMETMQEHGKETARSMYGVRGFVCHHNTDFYGDCAPQDQYLASTPWVTGSAWLALQVYDAYRFTGDHDLLNRLYPLMMDMALFYEDFLVEKDGELVTCPSVSPENRYLLPDGTDTPICAGPAMDSQILREFFRMCIEVTRLLGQSEDLIPVWENILNRLPKDRIGSRGQLLEWREEVRELIPDMGHVSHLYAVYPGDSINMRETPELMRAAAVSLSERRKAGAGKDGWPLAWYINLLARMEDGKEAGNCIRQMLAKSSSKSLLNISILFQIDGNLGAASGIAECLLQSHDGIRLLPALPPEWQQGKARGLCARGGHRVDLQWEAGRLTQATLHAGSSGMVWIEGTEWKVNLEGVQVKTEKDGTGILLKVVRGREYQICR